MIGKWIEVKLVLSQAAEGNSLIQLSGLWFNWKDRNAKVFIQSSRPFHDVIRAVFLAFSFTGQ